ncbi:sulfur carrier protein ThiS [Desertibacillus haloalkaliphilus]|uniref:sulfur carrier protein ThiS n=1 Tax=Desertibacillus haloalkaliphilus TaxID=1328930 RepID=UPI001C2576A3|nr:sulfur carrier protein ThiS [Desertibacillus haloalkaliphilus]MBU8905739.1 sulfur carrier protein ThiS [Desertibacillus haloalkaliphilus]
MLLYINGEEKQLDVSKLDEVVKHYQLEGNLVVTEINGEIVDREDWEDTELKEGMKIELVHFVGGG